MHLNRHLVVLSALLGTAGMLANSAYTRDASRIVSYACPSGEQFTVEYLRDHIRLRTGAGVFALANEPAASGEKYSDGQTVFWSKGDYAQLERQGLPRHTDCSARERQL
ncbi:MliC family protein [Aromatoleum diolicum]|uniref:C-type lysozyme inhibitor domain-containing protein n=1 Tax=Aromatoleum diolicum TaxID=75796 RepID=A0ABX1QBW4_9RHOO|nr:MliC family protein [Aromatoleum diolicum]NMG75525.1 hypothetical protein [Aromatoleum diolicum]